MRVLTRQDGRWVVREDVPVAEVRKVEEEDDLTWLRLDRASPEDIKTVADAYELHPIVVQELTQEDARPIAEDLPGLTFCVLPVPDYKADKKELDWEEVAVFLGADFVVTLSPETIQPFDELEKRLTDMGTPTGEDSLSHLFYWIIDTIVDSWFPFIETLENELDELESGVLESAEKAELERIRQIKRLVGQTRKITLPMRDVVVGLERDDHPNMDDRTNLYLRSTSDRMKRVVERLDYVKEMALISQDTWNASLANEQNHVMKRLTVLAGLLLIPSLVAGIGGMNFGDFPAQWSFWWFNGGIIAFITLGFFFAWRKGML